MKLGLEVRDALLGWYREHARDLPWRHDVTPYRVWVSELMLQQTRVESVIEPYHRFLARFPTLEALAQAPLDDVLHAWSGLGYYRRARHLHEAAKRALVLGGLPREPAALRALPGIGPYTAAAIASIAWGLPVAAVDGNVERVMSRLGALEGDVKNAAVSGVIRAQIEAWSEPAVASMLTQALMELGATVCHPRTPACARCPIQAWCKAYARGEQARFPVTKPRTPPLVRYGVAAIWRCEEGRVWMGQRPSTGLLAGLWEPVMTHAFELPPGEDALATMLKERACAELISAERLGSVTHVFTHRKLTLDVFRVRATARPAERTDYAQLAWVDAQAPSVGLSGLAIRVLSLDGVRKQSKD